MDRLIRDVATGVRIAGVYANAKRRGVSDWGPVHQQGADMMLRLIQVNRGVYIKVQCSVQCAVCSHWQKRSSHWLALCVCGTVWATLGTTAAPAARTVRAPPSPAPSLNLTADTSRYVNTMAACMHEAPRSSLAAVLGVLRAELGRDPDTVFSSFAESPIASASLAQVHEARLRDGTRVAVKVRGQHTACHG